jgi:tRNA nucleotidyltransferase/poly(A) polymerase
MRKLMPDGLPRRAGAYRVGGCVRDLPLGREPAGCDVALLGPAPEHALQLAAAAGGRVAEIGKAGFRVWRVTARGRFVDVSPVAGQSIAADLRQRDFTINPLAVDTAAGALLDIAGGRRDLENGVIRW